ncbi:MAG: hypothetical protein WBP08_17845 [Saprospiraceae bacterium]|jgi:4-hydroxybenzoate polyprenyltransferase
MSRFFINYLHHFYHLALSICFLTAITYTCAGNKTDWKFSIWVSLATFLVYNFHDVLKFKNDEILKFVRTNILFTFLILASSLVGLLLMSQDFYQILFFATAIIFCIFYFRPNILWNKSGRDHFLLKPLLIGLVFGILTALIPYLQSGYNLSESLLLTLGRVSFVMSLAILFDIGDVIEDTGAHAETIPSRFGIKQSKVIAILLLIFSIIIEGYGAWIFLIEFPVFITFCIGYIFSFFLIIFSTAYRPSWYYLLLVDGMMMLPWLLFQM